MSINLLNEARPFEVNSVIIEWDIQRAGLNLIKEYHLLPEDEIRKYESLSKKESDIAIGKRQIGDKEFSKAFDQSFTDIMKLFLEENSIDSTFDVISIKKDACFVINKYIKKTEFGKYIRFIEKNKYHAFLYIKPFEFYFKRNGDIEVKNFIGDKDARKRILSLHENGILNFLECVVDTAEIYGRKSKEMNQFLHSFVEMYKKRELNFDYYREFSTASGYRYQFAGGEIMADNIDESMFQKVNIEANYKNIILPLINIII